mgnify:FL=1
MRVATAKLAGNTATKRASQLVLALLGAAWVRLAGAAGGTDFPLHEMEPNLDDKASLQRGMRTYMNYCMGCHSLKYQRYERTADDIGIPHDLVLEHLVFDKSTKIGDLMENNMSVENAKTWFGAVPPDLTLYTKLKKGPNYLYTYLRTFYADESRPFGVNNLLFENVGMPHALIELQGMQTLRCVDVPSVNEVGVPNRDPATNKPIVNKTCGMDLIPRGHDPLVPADGSGSLSPKEYDRVVYDLVNFLTYVGDPGKQNREQVGVYVLLFLAFFFVFAWLLEREYWKDVH